MSKDIISEGPAMRKFMNIVAPRAEFGKKPAETEDQAAERRTKEVTDRANAEKKSFGFLRSVAQKTFGKKGEPVKQDRSEEERRQAVVDRAKVNEDEGLSEKRALALWNAIPACDAKNDAINAASDKDIEDEHEWTVAALRIYDSNMDSGYYDEQGNYK